MLVRWGRAGVGVAGPAAAHILELLVQRERAGQGVPLPVALQWGSVESEGESEGV